MADYKSRMQADNEQAEKILRKEAPVQATKGVMTNAERKASIMAAVGAKGEFNTGRTDGICYSHDRSCYKSQE